MLVCALACALAASCSSEPALLRQARKEDLIEAIRAALLESVVAEKSAVLATSDEESQSMAREAQGFTAKIDALRGELRPLVAADGRPKEIEQLDAFDGAWTELKRVDENLLALAVANTNLKAAQLSAREGAAALDRFVDAIAAAQATSSDVETVRTLSRAAVAGLREQSLLLIHVPAADPAEMTRLEQRMNDLAGEVARSLAAARAAGADAAQLALATSAWDQHREIAVEVVRLSRENSNVVSFDVSVHEKRHVTEICLNALDALQAAIDANPKAAR
jgi:hypothetical protein